MYVDHSVMNMNVKIIEPHCLDLNDSNEEVDEEESLEDIDNDVKGVSFDDSQDEKTTTLNGGFEVIEADRIRNGSNIVKIKEKSYRIKIYGSKSQRLKERSKWIEHESEKRQEDVQKLDKRAEEATQNQGHYDLAVMALEENYSKLAFH